MPLRDYWFGAIGAPLLLVCAPTSALAEGGGVSAAMTSAAAATTSAQPSPPAAAQGLPTGDDGAYRRRLLDWAAPPTVRLPEVKYVGGRALGLPVAAPRLTSTFGFRSDPLGMGRRMHSGLDIPGPLGSAVRSTEAGVVSFAGWSGGYGNLVVVDHGGGVKTRYGHLLRPLVAAGEAVRAGDAVGLLGSTGRSTGPHVHYEVRIGGAAVDPLGVSAGFREIVVPGMEYLAPRPRDVPSWQDWRDQAGSTALPTPVIR
jgi:murein DD-endopeptidase MepM/ murein hydrolase activator NlpD